MIANLNAHMLLAHPNPNDVQNEDLDIVIDDETLQEENVPSVVVESGVSVVAESGVSGTTESGVSGTTESAIEDTDMNEELVNNQV